MKNAETVTFGGSGFNRAAELRADPSPLLSSPKARTILFWRGKPLVGNNTPELARLPLDHPALSACSGLKVFLGLDGEDAKPVFACDISSWQAPDLDAVEMKQFFDQSENSHPDLPEHKFVELRGVMAQFSAQDAELAATGRALFEWHKIHGFCANCGAKSEASMAGWQRDCPACERSHFPRTDPVVIMLITKGNNVLLGRSPGWPDAMYSLLAGFIEPGETVEAAVRRETWEEAGIKVSEVSYLASQPWPFPASLMIGCAGIAQNTDIKIDPAELEDAFWCPKERLISALSGEDENLKPARRGSIAQFLIQRWLEDTV